MLLRISISGRSAIIYVILIIQCTDQFVQSPLRPARADQWKQVIILVTGAGGTVGQILIETLMDHGSLFPAAYHNAAKAPAAQARGIETAIIDMHQPETLPPALEGINTVFLLCSGVQGQEEIEINLIEAAKSAGAGRVVKLSAWAAPQ
ncbi:MAG: NAD(P)H-binding protein [Pararhodobacter sp.]|nr:NAD(P)H-binding protein [Pararhodobacter sp.]